MNGNLALGIVGGCVRRHNAAVCVLCAVENIVRIIATERLVKFRISDINTKQYMHCPVSSHAMVVMTISKYRSADRIIQASLTSQ